MQAIPLGQSKLVRRAKKKKSFNILNRIRFGILYIIVLGLLCFGLIYFIRSYKMSQLDEEAKSSQEAIDGYSEAIKFKSREIFAAYEHQEDEKLEAILNDKIFPSEWLQKALYDYSWPQRPHLAEKCLFEGRLKPFIILFKSGLKFNIDELNLFNFAIKRLMKNENQLEFLKLLQKHGADMNKIDPTAKIPSLFLAISCRNPQALEFILKQSISPNQIHPKYNSALHFVVKNFDKNHQSVSIEMISILLKYGANPFILSEKSGLNPLHYAIKKYPDCLDLVGIFFKTPIPNCNQAKYVNSLVNHRTGTLKHPRGYTPLHLAVELGRLNLSKTLIELGADLSLKNSDGLTPPELASKLKSRKMRRLFYNVNKN